MAYSAPITLEMKQLADKPKVKITYQYSMGATFTKSASLSGAVKVIPVEMYYAARIFTLDFP